MLKIIISICLVFAIKSQAFQWTAELGMQYPGVTPLFSRLNSSLAIVSFLQDDNQGFHLLVHQYSIYGKLETKCDLIIPTVSKRIWDLKIQNENDSLLALSWLYSDGTELGVRVLQVNVARCSLRDTKVALYGDLDLVLYVPYYLLSRGDNGLFLFVKSPEICEGVCKFEIGNDRQLAAKDGTFSTVKDDSLIWRILPVDTGDLSKGYYYISEDSATQLAKIEKLNAKGRVLGTLRTKHNMSSDSFVVSSSHGRLSMCSSNNDCSLLLDPNTLRSTLNLSVRPSSASSLVNVGSSRRIGGFLIDGNAVRSFAEDGSATNRIRLFQGFERARGCFPRKMYEAFEMADDWYCTGRPCMRKANPATAFYQVSVAVECFQIL